MSNVAIVTDSTCCLPSELVQTCDIQVVPVYIIYQGRSYRDRVDITPGEIYKIMRLRKDLPTTSVPTPEDFLSVFKSLGQRTNNIVCITVTSLQSGVYNMAFTAKQMAQEVIPGITIEVIDSRAVAGSLGFIVLEATRLAKQGAGFAQIIETTHSMMNRVNFLGMLDTLYYLARTGRIARAAAWAGSLLNIKPIVGHFPNIGETTPVARARSRANGIERILDIMAERAGKSPLHVIVQHADEPEEAEKLRLAIQSRFNCSDVMLTEFSSAMGIHCGPGLIAVSFYTD